MVAAVKLRLVRRRGDGRYRPKFSPPLGGSPRKRGRQRERPCFRERPRGPVSCRQAMRHRSTAQKVGIAIEPRCWLTGYLCEIVPAPQPYGVVRERLRDELHRLPLVERATLELEAAPRRR